MRCSPLVSLYADMCPTRRLLGTIMCPCSDPTLMWRRVRFAHWTLTFITLHISLRDRTDLPLNGAVAFYFAAVWTATGSEYYTSFWEGWMVPGEDTHTHTCAHTKGVVKHEPSCLTASLSHLAQRKCAGNALGLIGLNACTCHCSMAGIEC